MTLNIHLPPATVMKPRITVFGVGGAGGNATNNMIMQKLEGANFVIANTDAQALDMSVSEKKIQLGQQTTQGLGAGADPEVGRAAAEEAKEEIQGHLQGSNMVFVTAGMGGGTGTGASSVIARIAREMNILTVGVVTKPFHFEGPRRMRIAEAGIIELQKNVDTLIVIPNQNLFRIANEKTTFAEAFALADEVLHAGVRGVTDLMVMPGLINLDFADIRTVMSEMGKAMMGTGEAEGEKRAQRAADAAISNPLLDNVSMKGAKGVLINITGGSDMTLFEVDEAANRVREEVDPAANVIFGSTFDEEMKGKIRVSVVATGIESDHYSDQQQASREQQNRSLFSGGISRPVAAQRPETIVAAAPADIRSERAAQSPVVQAVEAIKKDVQEAVSSIAAPQYEQEVKRFNWEYQESASQVQANNTTDDASSDATEDTADASGANNTSVSPFAQEGKPVVSESPRIEPQRPVFVAPRPVAPVSYDTNSPIHQSVHSSSEYESRERRLDGGLFSRMARGMTKTFNSGPERESYHAPHSNGHTNGAQKPELETVMVAAPRSDRKSQEDLLDIPAFLRRNSDN